MVNTDQEKTILRLKLTKNDYKNLLSQIPIYRNFGINTEKSHTICIIIHPEEFPITVKNATPKTENFGVYDEVKKEFLLKIALKEIISNKKIITGELSDPVPYYKNFEIHLVS